MAFGFIRRCCKVRGSTFLYNLLCACGNDHVSLQQHVNEYACEASISISREGVHKRFSKKFTTFVRMVFQKVLSLRLSGSISCSQPYSRVLIKDSTIFPLDKRHSSRFKGSGGSSSLSSLRIQFEYDVLGGNVYDIELRKGTENDSKDAERKSSGLLGHTLYIRDLGYVSESMMEKTSGAGGYYLNRIRRNAIIYKDSKKKYFINFSYLLQKMNRQKNEFYEMDVFMSTSLKPYRLILALVPKEVYRQRLKQWEKENKNKKIGKEQKARLRLNMYVTNVCRDALPAEYVFKLYSIRWQIGLMFKTWKSVFRLQTCTAMNTERYLTTLYAKLLMILLNWHIFHLMRREIYQEYSVFLSTNKCMKNLQLHAESIRKALRRNTLAETVERITREWKRLCLLDGQKKERSYTLIINFLSKKET